jgi:hypothetical protein
LSNPSGNGITFAIQGVGPTAIGTAGAGLGYGAGALGGTGGIPTSVAVKFDLYNSGGEGTNSTGLYTNGVAPITPATTLGGGVNLHSGDIMQVQITYDGTTLTMTITDTTTPSETYTISWPINIPATVGGNTAYVGFTGGTGGATALQQIVNWTYSVTPVSDFSLSVSPSSQSVTLGGNAVYTATIAASLQWHSVIRRKRFAYRHVCIVQSCHGLWLRRFDFDCFNQRGDRNG